MARPISTKKYAALRRGLLSPLAEDHELSYDLETMDPGSSAEQVAFGLVAAGSQLPLSLAYEFPSGRRGVRSRGIRLAKRGLQGEAGERAAVVGAHVLAVLAGELSIAEGEELTAQAHFAQRELLGQFYPLPAEDLEPVEAARAEFRTLDGHVVREEVRVGAETGTGYHLVLMDGGNPDADPELVDVQRRYASSYLRNAGLLAVLRRLIGDAEFESMDRDLYRTGTLDPGFLSWDAGLLYAFGDWIGEWTDVLRRPL